MQNHHENKLIETLRRLAGNRALAFAVKRLDQSAQVLNEELRAAVMAQIPAYSESGNPDILPELAQHAMAHTAEILRLFGGGAIGDFEFVREHARRRAEQRFPLEAVLHAYRCGHKVFSYWVREAVMVAVAAADDPQQIVADVADFSIEYTDAVSTILANEYVTRTRVLAEAAGSHRAALLNILLDGYDESDGRVANILRDAGYLKQRQAFCVAVAQPVDPAEMLNPGRARRLIDAIDVHLDGSSGRRLIDVRDNKVVMIVSKTRRVSGWTAPRISLAGRIKTELATVGNAVFIGISNDVPSTSYLPGAYEEARLALDCADLAHRVVQLSEISVRQLLLRFSGKGIRRLLPRWSGAFFEADRRSDGALASTLRVYADADMNVLRTAKVLDVHPNTVYARLEKITEITCLDPRSFHALTEMLIVVDCRDDPMTSPTAPASKVS